MTKKDFNAYLKEEKIKVSKSFNENKTYSKENWGGNVYRVNLKKGDKTSTFFYTDSKANQEKGTKPTNKAMIYALKLDKDSSQSVTSYQDVKDEFGYEDTKKAKKVYTGLKSNELKYHKIFSKKEDEYLDKIYENY